MTLIKVRNNKIIPIYVLYRMVLDLVYAPETLSIFTVDAIFASIKQYERTFNWARANGILMSAVEEEVEHVLSNINEIMEQDAQGKLEARKKLFKETGVCYKKFHRLPEAYTAQDFINGQRALEEHKKANPEEYQ